MDLSPADCRRVLRRNHVGRLAYLVRREIQIVPIGYAMRGKWLFARSAPGAKLDAVAHRPYVAFEVDEVRGPQDWHSVVVLGSIFSFPADGSPVERRTRRRARAAIKAAMPAAFTDRDPFPERDNIYGVHIERVTGRVARSVLLQPQRE